MSLFIFLQQTTSLNCSVSSLWWGQGLAWVAYPKVQGKPAENQCMPLKSPRKAVKLIICINVYKCVFAQCAPCVLSVLISLSTLTYSCRCNCESWESLCFKQLLFYCTFISAELRKEFSQLTQLLCLSVLEKWLPAPEVLLLLTSSPFWRGRHLVPLEVELQISFYKFMNTFGIWVFSFLLLETKEHLFLGFEANL